MAGYSQPGQLERQPSLQGDLDEAAGPGPGRVAVLADAADQVLGPAPVVAGVLAPTALALEGPVFTGGWAAVFGLRTRNLGHP